MRKFLTLLFLAFSFISFGQGTVASDPLPLCLSTQFSQIIGTTTVTTGTNPNNSCGNIPGNVLWYKFETYSGANGASVVDIVVSKLASDPEITASFFIAAPGGSFATMVPAGISCVNSTLAVGATDLTVSYTPTQPGEQVWIMIDGGTEDAPFEISMQEQTPNSGTVSGAPIANITTDAPQVSGRNEQCISDNNLDLEISTLVNGLNTVWTINITDAGNNPVGAPINFAGVDGTKVHTLADLNALGIGLGTYEFEIVVQNACGNIKRSQFVSFVDMTTTVTPQNPKVCLDIAQPFQASTVINGSSFPAPNVDHTWAITGGTGTGSLTVTSQKNTLVSNTSFTATAAGTFAITHTARFAGCENITTRNFEVFPLPEPNLAISQYRNPFCNDEEFVFVELDTTFTRIILPIDSSYFSGENIPFAGIAVPNQPNDPVASRSGVFPPGGVGAHPNVIEGGTPIDTVRNHYVDSVSSSGTGSYTWFVVDTMGCTAEATAEVTPFSPPTVAATPSTICVKEQFNNFDTTLTNPAGINPGDTAGLNQSEWVVHFVVAPSTDRSDTASNDGYISNGLITPIPPLKNKWQEAFDAGNALSANHPNDGSNADPDSLMSNYRYIEWVKLEPPVVIAGVNDTLHDSNPCFNIITDNDAAYSGMANGLGMDRPDSTFKIPNEVFWFDSLAFARSRFNTFATPDTCPTGTWTFKMMMYDGATGCSDELSATVEFGDTTEVAFTRDTLIICEGQVATLFPDSVLTDIHSGNSGANVDLQAPSPATWTAINVGTGAAVGVTTQTGFDRQVIGLENLTQGVYRYVLEVNPTIPGGGCTSGDTIFVEVLAPNLLDIVPASDPTSVIIDATDTARFCVADTFFVKPAIGNGTGGFRDLVASESVRWFLDDDFSALTPSIFLGNGDTLRTNTLTTPGQIIMEYTNAAGCILLDTLPFSPNPLPDTTSTITVQPTQPNIISTSTSPEEVHACAGDTIVITIKLANEPDPTDLFFVEQNTKGVITRSPGAIADPVTFELFFRAIPKDTTGLKFFAVNGNGCEIEFNDTSTIILIPKPVVTILDGITDSIKVCITGNPLFPTIDFGIKTGADATTIANNLPRYTYFSLTKPANTQDTILAAGVRTPLDTLAVSIPNNLAFTDSIFVVQLVDSLTGCVSDFDSTIVVMSDGEPFVLIPPDSKTDTVCIGDSLAITGITTNGNVTWKSKNGGTFSDITIPNPKYLPNPNNTNQDTLTITLTSPGCTPIDSIVVVDVFDGARANITTTAPAQICSGDTLFGLVGDTSINTTAHVWSSGIVEGVFTTPASLTTAFVVDTTLNQDSVTIYLTATNNDDVCNSHTDSIKVKPVNNGPILSLNVTSGNDTTICQGQSLDLAFARIVGETINWSAKVHPNDSIKNTTSANPIFTPVSTFIGTDTLMVKVTNAACPSNDSTALIVNVTVAPTATITSAVPNSVCTGDTIFLVGTVANGDSTWTSSFAGGTFKNDSDLVSNYYVVDTALNQDPITISLITNGKGKQCATDTARFTINTVINGPISAIITTNGTDTICQGTQLNIDVTKARIIGNANWTTSPINKGSFDDSLSATPLFTPLATLGDTSINLIVTSQVDNCTNTATDSLLLYIKEGPVAQITATRDTTCQGFSYQLNSTSENGSIKWTAPLGTGSFNFDTIANPVYTASANELFNIRLFLTVTNSGGGAVSCGNGIDSIDLVVTPTATVAIDTTGLNTVNNVFNACSGSKSAISASVSLPADSISWTTNRPGFMVIDTTDKKNISFVPHPDSAGQVFLYLNVTNAPCGIIRDTLEINVVLGPSFTLSPLDINGFTFSTDTSCAFEQREIKLTVNNANPLYSYFLSKPIADTLGRFENFPGSSPAFIVSPDTTTTYNISVSAANCSVDSSLTINVHSIPTAVVQNDTANTCLFTVGVSDVKQVFASINSNTEGGFWTHNGAGSWLLNDSSTNSPTYKVAAADTLKLVQMIYTPTDVARCGADGFTIADTMYLKVNPNAYFGGISVLSAYTTSSAGQLRVSPNQDTLYVLKGMKSIVLSAEVFNTTGLTWAASNSARGTITELPRSGNTESMQFNFDPTDGVFAPFFLTATPTSECNPLGSDTIHVVFNKITTTNVITNTPGNTNLIFKGYAEGGSLVVFDRWGLKVYASTNYRNDWDGDILEDDTYFYIFTFNGQSLTGYVRLMREL